MSASAFSFVACSADTPLQQIAATAEGSAQLILGAEACSDLVEAEFTGIDQPAERNPKQIDVIPLTGDGDLIWNRLPAEVAVLTTPPTHSAIFIVSGSQLGDSADKSLWEWLHQQYATLRVGCPLGNADSPLLSYPDLVPAENVLPDWLANACTTFRPAQIASEPDAIALTAGLLQIHDKLDHSHHFSQECQGEGRHVAGDYWHAIMHRREPDYGNSKYWFRRVGDHPIFPELAEHAHSLLSTGDASAQLWNRRLTANGWDPFSFVDLCEMAERGVDKELLRLAKILQWREMILLLEQTWQDAVGI